MTPAQGARVRLQHVLENLERAIESLRLAMTFDAPIGHEAPQVIANEAYRVAVYSAEADAYWRAEQERFGKALTLRDGRRVYRDHVQGCIATLRESWRNDGAEGESVHLLCDVLETLMGS